MNKTILLFFVLLLAASACKKSPTGEETILQLLHKEDSAFYNHRNIFSPEAKVAYADSLLQHVPNMPASLILYKANALLELGRTEDAIAVLEILKSRIGEKPTDSASVLYINSLALAYLRLGEQNNCINNHSAESCVFPIRGRGVHMITTGSSHAAQLYEALLQRNPTDLESRWLLNIAYMTLGKYPGSGNYIIPGLNSDTADKVKPFEDIAGDLKMNIRNMAGGVIIEDFDNDEDLDVVTSSMSLKEHMHYFRNNGDGTFTDIAEATGLKKFTGGLNMMQTDYNNDGLKDIFVTRGGWMLKFGAQPNSLLRNNGDGTFTDVTIEAGLLSFHPTQAATWNDFNNDGWLDVFIGNESDPASQTQHPSEFYINNQDGTFTEISSKAGCDFALYVKGVTSGDYDHDGWKDIYVSTMNPGGNMLLRNTGVKNGNVVFENVTSKAMPVTDNKSFPTWFWDFDNDGWLDVMVCDYSFRSTLAYYAAATKLNVPEKNIGQVYLYKNNRNGTFTNVSEEMGLNHVSVFAMGSNFGDIDNDGYLDMYMGTGNPDYRSLVPNKMFHNIGGKRFADVTTSAKVGNLQKGHAVGFADLDNDGDQDIYIDMGGAYIGDAYSSCFYNNPGQSDNNWIYISLEGTESNRLAIGSSIKVTFREDGKSREVHRDVNSGGSFGSSPLRREIGIGKAKTIDAIEVHWHGSGKVQRFTNIKPNQYIRIKEGEDVIVPVQLKKIEFKKGSGTSHCHDPSTALAN